MNFYKQLKMRIHISELRISREHSLEFGNFLTSCWRPYSLIPLQQAGILRSDSPVHSARQSAGRPQSEHLSGYAHHNLPAQSQNHLPVLPGSEDKEDKRKISIGQMDNLHPTHLLPHCQGSVATRGTAMGVGCALKIVSKI